MQKNLCFILIFVLLFAAFTGCKKYETPQITATEGTEPSSTPTTEMTENTTTEPTQNPTTATTENTTSTETPTESGNLSLPLDEAYAYAVKQYDKHPESHRDLGELQPETQQIIEMDGKYYQSYVAANVDIRYIWISQPEFPDGRLSLWDWYTVGTANVYSLELLGKIDEGRR